MLYDTCTKMKSKENIESIVTSYRFPNDRWINPHNMIVRQWVRAKCIFGCSVNRLGTCPPNTLLVNDCKTFFSEYNSGLVLVLNKLVKKDLYLSKLISLNVIHGCSSKP